MEIGYMLSRVIMIVFVMGVSSISFLPTLVGQLPLDLYIPNAYGLNFYSITALEVMFLWIATVVDLGFDITFAGSCTHVVMQLKMIKHVLRNIPFSEREDSESLCHHQLKKCIEHKARLNKVIEMISSSYSLILFVHFCSTIVGVCLELYLALQ